MNLSRLRRLVPFLLFLFTLSLAALFALRMPPWQAPDEPAHYAYVATLADEGTPPVLVPRCYNESYKNSLVAGNFREPIAFERFCYEGHQPPVFYYLALPLFLASGGSLLALRLFCAIVGALVPVVSWRVVRRSGAGEDVALATALLVAVIPQHLAMLGSLNNDGLTYLLVAVAVFHMLPLARGASARDVGGEGASHRGEEWLRLGVLVGLCLLTKTLAWVVLPLSGITLLLSLRHLRGRRESSSRSLPGASPQFAPLLRRALLLFGVALLLVLPWMVRNVALYGGADVMGLERHDEIAVGQPRTAEEIAARGVGDTVVNGATTVFHSFWGQFGWMKAPLQPGEYRVLALFSLLGLSGLLVWVTRGRWRTWGICGEALLLFGAWVATIGAMLLYYNLEFVQYQGRYLFPALTPIVFFLVVGTGIWFPRRARPVPWLLLLLFLLYLDVLAVVERLPGMLMY